MYFIRNRLFDDNLLDNKQERLDAKLFKPSIFSNYDKNINPLLVIFLVNYHMLAHEIHTEKAINKYKSLFGEDLFNLLMKFQKCDSLASGTAGEIDL